MFTKFREYLKLESTIRQLERLSTRELDDLGIARGNIRDAVKGKTKPIY